MDLSEYAQYDAVGLAELVKRKQVTAKELGRLFLIAVENVNPKINAVIEILLRESDGITKAFLASEIKIPLDALDDNLLLELKNGGMTRRKIDFDQTALKQLYTIVLRVDARLATADCVDKAFGKTKFTQTSKALSSVGFGFTPDDVANVWIYTLLGIFSTETEVMRQYLLQALADKPPFNRNRFITLKPLMNGIVTCCPNFGATFAKEIDVELRNALAHETYWIAEDTTVTPTKLKLRYIDELGDTEKDKPFSDVLFRARLQNLLTSIIAKQIQDKYDSGWFN